MTRRVGALVLAALLLTPPLALAQSPPPTAGAAVVAADSGSEGAWPREMSVNTYVLISGRWFRARSTDGPWEYVPGGQLPPDFARIPEGGASGVVLASVPGTPQAQEAVIANSIPQTATVTRAAAHFTATYDGPPQWRPIAGTPLVYAANAPTPLIRVDARTYCESGGLRSPETLSWLPSIRSMTGEGSR